MTTRGIARRLVALEQRVASRRPIVLFQPCGLTDVELAAWESENLASLSETAREIIIVSWCGDGR